MDGDRHTNSRLTITGYNHFVVLISLIGFLSAILISQFWFKFDPVFLTICAIFFALDALPAFYLHWEYWAANRGMEFTLEPDKIIRKEKDRKVTFSTEEMDRIVVYKSASIDKGGIPILAIESYHYARIYLNSGEELIITCLLAPNVSKAVRKVTDVPLERKKRGFNSLMWE